jgi:hypothetical protein
MISYFSGRESGIQEPVSFTTQNSGIYDFHALRTHDLKQSISAIPIRKEIIFISTGESDRPNPGRPTPGTGGDLGTVKLRLQTTIETHPQTFFACTRWIFGFYCF